MPHAIIALPNLAESNEIINQIEQAGFTVSVMDSFFAVQKMMVRFSPAIAFIDISLLNNTIEHFLKDSPWSAKTTIILLAKQVSQQDLAIAKEQGARDYVAYSSITADYLANLLHEPEDLKFHGYLVGESKPMQRLYEYINKVSPTMATVFLVGESGSGKELVAKTVHEKSQRAKGPYIAINCGAISKDLIGSALFGHEKGSFTGAVQAHQGYFEQASGGTIFLDEITETSADLQIRLLRVLETSKVIPVGGKRQIDIDVRVIAATNREPLEAVKEGILREDLYYRLNIFPIKIPALRERLDDIKLLTAYFLQEFNNEAHKDKTITPGALEKLEKYCWPGNVRELKNIIQRAYILSEGVIDKQHIVLDDFLSL